jgi:hypothetical protein
MYRVRTDWRCDHRHGSRIAPNGHRAFSFASARSLPIP